MTSIHETVLSSSRVCGPPSVNIDLLECSVCHELLWKPVACQICETPFCSACITRWLANNPKKCPNRCEAYTERKCPPFVAKLLAQLQITCFYQSHGCQEILSYEALDKHEIECDYQFQQCTGCQSEILKKDFDNHQKNCVSIKLTCEDCQLVYRRGDATTKHTENICLREQVRKLRDETKENKRMMQELTCQLNDIDKWKKSMTQEVTIRFDDLPDAKEQLKPIHNVYKGFKWSDISYAHGSYMKVKYPTSGYVTSFTTGGSPHIAYFKDEGSISVERINETFTLVSLTACAAWNDDLQFTITGHRNSIQINIHTTTLLFGKPEPILLYWKDIDKIILKSSGGTTHPGSDGSGRRSQVVITQLTISQTKNFTS